MPSSTVGDLQAAQRKRAGRGRPHPRSASGAERDHEAEGHEQITEEAEKEQLRREAEERDKAIELLKADHGGSPATEFMLQITGPEVELPVKYYPRFGRDVEVKIDVAGVELRGWVKTHKTSTVKKGGHAAKTVVVVIEEAEETAQMRIGETA